MKIDRISTFIVDSGLWKNWLFVKVETDEGLHGWGEAFTEAGRERAIAAEVDAFGRRLIGQDPLLIRRHVAELQVNAASRRRSLEFCSALSGIEIALWDLAGKAMGQPVHALLGGRHRDRIRVYSNCHDGRVSTPEEWAALCSRMVARGFAAVKIYPVWRPVVTRHDEDEAVAIVAAVRHAVGPDIDLMLDLSRSLTPVQAVRMAARLE